MKWTGVVRNDPRGQPSPSIYRRGKNPKLPWQFCRKDPQKSSILEVDLGQMERILGINASDLRH